MRFEKLLWVMLALFLSGAAGVGEDTLVGAVSDFQATDGTSDIPPPGVSGEYQASDGTTDIPPRP